MFYLLKGEYMLMSARRLDILVQAWHESVPSNCATRIEKENMRIASEASTNLHFAKRHVVLVPPPTQNLGFLK